MARLVAVCHNDEFNYSRRQLPLIVDGCSTLVMQFDDACMNCNKSNTSQMEFERFLQKYQALTTDEIIKALSVTNKELLGGLSQVMPCVGCRRCVESLFSQCVVSRHLSALEPLNISTGSELSVDKDSILDPHLLFALFHMHGSKLNSIIDSIPIGRKNKRCALHCLETHKSKSLGIWEEVWNLMLNECRDEVIVLDYAALSITLDDYLRKHKFCVECKSKVQKALKLLVSRDNAETEKCTGFNISLFDGLTTCPEKHVHIRNDSNLVRSLVTRAEPELKGCTRERHAKTWDVAQEEVLTAVGVHLYDRLYRIWQKLKVEEQAWQILFHVGVDLLRKGFEQALENKRGITNLELLCRELEEKGKSVEMKGERKRQKRKRKKENGARAVRDNDREKLICSNKKAGSCHTDCNCDAKFNHKLINNKVGDREIHQIVSNVDSRQIACDIDNHQMAYDNRQVSDKHYESRSVSRCCMEESAIDSDESCNSAHQMIRCRDSVDTVDGSGDCRKCKDGNANHQMFAGCISSSSCSSWARRCCDDNSVASNHSHGADSNCDVCSSCNCCDGESSVPSTDSQTDDDREWRQTEVGLSCQKSNPKCHIRTAFGPSLQDMLETCHLSTDEFDMNWITEDDKEDKEGEEKDWIPAEDKLHFEANRKLHDTKRLELRQQLRQNFANYVHCKSMNGMPGNFARTSSCGTGQRAQVTG